MLVSTGLILGFVGGILCDLTGDFWRTATWELYSLPAEKLKSIKDRVVLKNINPISNFILTGLITAAYIIMVIRFAIDTPMDGVLTFWGYLLGGVIGKLVLAFVNKKAATKDEALHDTTKE